MALVACVFVLEVGVQFLAVVRHAFGVEGIEEAVVESDKVKGKFRQIFPHAGA